MGFRVAFRGVCFIAITSCAIVAHAQSDDTVKHLPAKAIEITALRPSDLPTIDPRGAEIKLTSTLYRQTGSYLASDALRAMSSSLDVRRYGTLGAIAIPSFRGLPAAYTIVYRDGIRLTNEQLGETDFGQLTLHGLSHIELIPASSAVLLGGDAIGAAINLVSAVSDTAHLRIGTEQTNYAHGSGFPAQSYYATVAITPLPEFFLVASGTLDQSSGSFPFFDSTSKEYIPRENNDATVRSANASAIWEASAHTMLRLNTNYFYADRGAPGEGTTPGRGAASLTARQSDEQYFAAIKAEHEDGPLAASLALNLGRQSENYRDRAYSINSLDSNFMYGATSSVSYEVSPALKAFVGIDYLHTRLTGNTNSTTSGDSLVSRDRGGAYVAARIVPREDLSINGSFRVEKISNLEAQLLPQAALDYSPFPNLTFGTAFSRSFHAPTLNDLYWHTVGGEGNDSLRPERGYNWEASAGYDLNWSTVSAHLGVTGFGATIEDEIVWMLYGGGTRPVNIASAESRGVEFRANARVSLGAAWNLALDESYTYLKSVNRTADAIQNGKELPYTTPTASLLILTLERERWGSFSVLARYRGHKFTDVANNINQELQPVTTLDVTVASSELTVAGLGVRAVFGIVNLTDTRFVEELNYPLPGRTYKFSIELNYH